MVPSNKTFTIQYDDNDFVTSRIKKSLPTKKYISYDNQKYSNLHDIEWYLGLVQMIETKKNYLVAQKLNG